MTSWISTDQRSTMMINSGWNVSSTVGVNTAGTFIGRYTNSLNFDGLHGRCSTLLMDNI